jgi:hypothetical protein
VIAQGGERSTYENRVVGQAVGDLSRGKHRPPAASGQFEPAQGVHGRSQAAVGTHPAAVRAESRVVRQACGSAAGWAERGVGASRKVRCHLVRWSSSRLTSAAASRSAALSRTSPSGNTAIQAIARSLRTGKRGKPFGVESVRHAATRTPRASSNAQLPVVANQSSSASASVVSPQVPTMARSSRGRSSRPPLATAAGGRRAGCSGRSRSTSSLSTMVAFAASRSPARTGS